MITIIVSPLVGLFRILWVREIRNVPRVTLGCREGATLNPKPENPPASQRLCDAEDHEASKPA